MKDEYDVTPAGNEAVARILRDHHYDGSPMDQYVDPSGDAAGAEMETESVTGANVGVQGDSSRATEDRVDISYGGSSKPAVAEKQVLCRPLDFSCFFGFSR